MQIQDTYLVLETPDGMLVIDQHALHERILFEQLRRRIRAGQLEVQRLLIPEPIDLEVNYDEVLGPREEAYQRLLDDAMDGDARRFGREDALDEQWRIVEDVLDHHEEVHLYTSGTMGPKEADRLTADTGGWITPLPPAER